MNTKFVFPALALLATSALPLAAQAPAAAAAPAARAGRGPQRPQGPTPHFADGTVDLSGVWNGGGPVGDIELGLPKGEKVPLNAAGLKAFSTRQSKDDPEANCLPTGIP